MKKFLFSLLVLCTTFSTANAQIKFGARAGVNVVNMSVSDDTGYMSSSNHAGFYVGPTVKLTLPVVGLSFDGSVEYDQRTSEIGSESLTMKQIAIPINVRYGVGLGSTANVFLFTGPQFGFNLASDKTFDESSTEKSEWSWKKSHFSWNVGIGATVLSHLEVKASYNIACGTTGEATVTNTLTQAAKSVGTSKYNSWQVGLAWYF